MTSRDFVYWLQGYFEIGDEPADTLNPKQVECIRKHLALVFKHEIDPSMGPPEKQAELNAIHGPAPKPSKPEPQIGGHAPGRPDVLYRC